MILAAGRGERMRPLTDRTPKPLLPVQGKPLLQWHLEALARGQVSGWVVNTAWLDDQISVFLNSFGISGQHSSLLLDEHSADRIYCSHEGRDFGTALETAGGIVRALPWLGEVFWVLAGDVFVPGFNFDPAAVRRFVASGMLAHLWLVPNPVHHPQGDFALAPDGRALNEGVLRHTYSTIGLYRSALFAPPYCDIAAGNPQGVKAALAPVLRAAIRDGRVSAELYTGAWTDVGTPDRLDALNRNTPSP
jgi:MurNAc alpha-1-phosphate uridylyltransferase